MKLVGAILIFLAGLSIGFHMSTQLAKRTRQLRLMAQALLRLETEIAYGATPLPDALLAASRSLDRPLQTILHDAARRMTEENGEAASTCWTAAITAGWHGTAMKAAERDALVQLGQSLGISDREDQRKHLRLAVRQLEQEEQLAASDEQRYAGMWKSLGALGGALVVILMY